jgi:hypothetical protein
MRYLLVTILLIVTSCGVFEPRDPEEPTKGNSSFVPPTTYSIVIQNLVQAIAEKNTDNYISCFVSSSDMPDYIFVPSGEILATYPDMTSYWNIGEEKRYFTTEIASLPESATPSLSLSELNYESLSPDSISFTSDYSLKVPTPTTSINAEYKGKLQFIVIKNKLNGLWFVYYWKDISIENFESWSSLKAKS